MPNSPVSQYGSGNGKWGTPFFGNFFGGITLYAFECNPPTQCSSQIPPKKHPGYFPAGGTNFGVFTECKGFPSACLDTPQKAYGGSNSKACSADVRPTNKPPFIGLESWRARADRPHFRPLVFLAARGSWGFGRECWAAHCLCCFEPVFFFFLSLVRSTVDFEICQKKFCFSDHWHSLVCVFNFQALGLPITHYLIDCSTPSTQICQWIQR